MKETPIYSQMGFISDKDNCNLEELVLEETVILIFYCFLFYVIN